ncbi:uncharacterized protein STEHIDRAFT_107224 [Stereum hirsutum FP-91666 SS1]|uniref:uncharacterized protein n=1 Tax=Stereum hirsutum (strain FP-91666) TaxID=721885 RepID=UPI000440FB9F|nr:uncharacterized protein STEHIDRAFT_107224 [Stereum hirsutum FP-91666 SS1]EIM92833.1 hypothetical protein STEHIDRAFT_107224 [Stereum hirsutum FP-91666 SS1]
MIFDPVNMAMQPSDLEGTKDDLHKMDRRMESEDGRLFSSDRGEGEVSPGGSLALNYVALTGRDDKNADDTECPLDTHVCKCAPSAGLLPSVTCTTQQSDLRTKNTIVSIRLRIVVMQKRSGGPKKITLSEKRKCLTGFPQSASESNGGNRYRCNFIVVKALIGIFGKMPEDAWRSRSGSTDLPFRAAATFWYL